ncbi:hypothetical protein F4860DRAFT_512968 [Xylaria cubensis]|nr:hypothetical protein F4860DRAFT_512968 [Xylaria cubensis]
MEPSTDVAARNASKNQKQSDNCIPEDLKKKFDILLMNQQNVVDHLARAESKDPIHIDLREANPAIPGFLTSLQEAMEEFAKFQDAHSQRLQQVVAENHIAAHSQSVQALSLETSIIREENNERIQRHVETLLAAIDEKLERHVEAFRAAIDEKLERHVETLLAAIDEKLERHVEAFRAAIDEKLEWLNHQQQARIVLVQSAIESLEANVRRLKNQ